MTFQRRPPAAPARLLELSREVREVAGRLASAGLELHQRRPASLQRGYLAATRLDGSRGGGGGDPVGDLVAGAIDASGTSSARRAYGEVADALEACVALLQSAEAAANAVLSPVQIAPLEEHGCTAHAAHGFRGVPTRSPGGDLCRWCSDFYRKYRQRPSLNDVQMLEERRVHAEQQRRAA